MTNKLITNFVDAYMKQNFILYCFFALIFLCGCKTILPKITATPYQQYKKSLENAGLKEAAIYKNWVRAGVTSLQSTIKINNLPYRETGYFDVNNLNAYAFEIKGLKGQQLSITLETTPKDSLFLFLDFWEKTPDGLLSEIEHVQTADTLINYLIKENVTLVIRLQPELLKGGNYRLDIIKSPQYTFPVKGMGNKAIQSFWGVDRDGGARQHQGIDIFAPKGTPVLAVADGRISAIQETNLGGLVVWQNVNNQNHSAYYAHLSKQLVNDGDQVKRGDTVGLVGNTGNARTTTPHLHFGIYEIGGAIDPLLFVQKQDTTLSSKLAYEIEDGALKMIKLKADAGNIYPVNMLASTSKSIRVKLPDGIVSTLNMNEFEFSKKLLDLKLSADKEVFTAPDQNKTKIGLIKKYDKFSVFGKLEYYYFIKKGTLKGCVYIN